MRKFLPVLKIGLGGLALVGLVIVLNVLFQSRAVETGTREMPTGLVGSATRVTTREAKARAKPTKKARVDWADATLDQIQFGKANPVLSHKGRIRIWSWLPDNRRLLLDLEDPEAKDITSSFHVVTLDTKTGEIVEYGHRPNDPEPPAWMEQTQSVVFRYSNSVQGKPREIRVGHAGGEMQALVEPSLFGVTARPTSGDIYYLLDPKSTNPLRAIPLGQQELSPRIPFVSLVLPTGYPRIDLQGRYLAILGRPDLPILDLSSGRLQTFQVTDFVDGKPSRWAMSGAWSPVGDQMGLILNQEPTGESTLGTTALGLLRFESSQIQVTPLPAIFIKEIDWSPAGRFLLARGVKGAYDKTNLVWLVDIASGKFKEVSSFQEIFGPEETTLAWSKDGKVAWVKYDTIMLTEVNP